MTIKLKGTDGSVSLTAPSDTSPSGSDITLTLPTTVGSAEQFLKNSGTAGELEYSSMVETSTGVGIATSSPQVDFHIGNADGASRSIVIHTQNNGDARLRFREGSTVASGYNEYSIGMDGSSDGLTFEMQGQGEVGRFDGSGRLLVGTASELLSGNEKKLQMTHADAGAEIVLGRNDSSVSSGNSLGALKFVGNDGGTYQQCAKIEAIADADHADDDKPTRLAFSVTNDNSATSTEHMRIDSGGRILMANTGSFYSAGEALSVSTGNNGNTQVGRNTNASFSSSMLFYYASRSANSSYQFVKFASAAASDAEFILRGDGNAYADGSWNGGGADYAEYFEWSDGNTEAEDRRGISVVLDGDKIREAVAGEEPIGVISGNPSVVGDADIEQWKHKYLRDDYGSYLWEDYEVEDEDGNTVVQQRRQLNPAWNSENEYVSREDRPEWDTVGLMGKLRIRKGQVTGARWIKMRDVSDTVEEWLVR